MQYVSDGTTWRRSKYLYVNDGTTWRRVKVGYVNDGSTWRKAFPPAIPTLDFTAGGPSANFGGAFSQITLTGFTLGGASNARGYVAYPDSASTLGTLGTYLSNPGGSNPYFAPAIVRMDLNPARETLAWDWAAADLVFTVKLEYQNVPSGGTTAFNVAGTAFTLTSTSTANFSTTKTVTIGAFGSVSVT